ncbi:PH domain-containing protein [Kineococcus terrestris]|uniref:PH domain-containing protein n=1 Tax=Kineococcus terrestris TaxID=2044856 RepID=UPI0034DB4A26
MDGQHPEHAPQDVSGRVSNHASDGAPDLTGLQTRYTQQTGRGLRVALLVLIGLQGVLAVVRLALDPDTVLAVLMIVQLALVVLFFGTYFVWTPATLLSPEGVRVQNGFPGARLIPWGQVREVQVQGRWQDGNRLVLQDGRSKRLIGVPAEDARRLADALAARAAG